MNYNKLISVVVPSFNTEMHLLEQCIESILNQKYDNLEIIIVDDGSKKEYAEKMDRLKEKSDIIKIIHQSNGGEGAARNTGIENSTGEYIIFVDSDDMLAEGWIEYAIKEANKNDADVVSGKVVRISNTNKIIQEDEIKIESKFLQDIDIKKLQYDFFYFKTDIVNNMDVLDPGVCSKLIRKKCIEKIRFPVGIKLSSDQVYNHMILRNIKRYVVTNKISYFYYMNEDSISHVYQPKAVDYMMKSMSLIKPLIYEDEMSYQAFYYRVFSELTTAIQFAYFSKRNKISFNEKIEGITYAISNEIAKECLLNIKYTSVNGFINKIKLFLLKQKQLFLYVLIKIITDFFE